MKSCSRYEDQTGQHVSIAQGQTPAPGVHKVTEHFYLLDDVTPSDGLWWFFISACLAPAALVWHARRRPAARVTKVLWFVEPPLLACLIYAGWSVLFLYDPDVGAYVGGLGVTLYFLGWAGAAYGKWRRWRQHRLAVEEEFRNLP